jgi:hypothetical protein
MMKVGILEFVLSQGAQFENSEANGSMCNRQIAFGWNPTMIARIITIALMIVLTALSASAQLDQILKGLGIGQPRGLGDAKISSGSKRGIGNRGRKCCPLYRTTRWVFYEPGDQNLDARKA